MKKFIKKNIRLIVIGAAIAVVFLMGIQSPRISSGITMRFARLLQITFKNFPGGNKTMMEINDVIRKIAHFGEYLILTSIIYTIIGYRIKKKIVHVLTVMLMIFIIAIFDEFFIQMVLSGGRTVSVYDIFYDLMGGVIGIVNMLLVEFIHIGHERHLKSEETWE